MHGRIVQYSHATGIGIIINIHKKLFDFKLLNWHDKTRIPETNLLVEFRVDDESNNVIYVKSSKYQEFDKDSIIKERDFWKTATDEELEKLEQNVFEELIAKTCKDTDYAILSSIKTSISIEKFIEYHFESETKIIKYALKLPTDGYELLDYRIVARFLTRTLDSLVYIEKRITKDTFSSYLQLYSKLQYFITPFYKAQQDSAKVFSEVFLSQQLYYVSAKRKLTTIKEDLLKANNRMRMLKSQIYHTELKLPQDKNNEIKDRLAKLRGQYEEVSQNVTHLNKLKEKIEAMLESFIKTYEKDFEAKFSKVRERIFEGIKNALNSTITSLDNKMWQFGMASDPIKNHYFKLQSNYSFCILAFIQQYIKTLDINKLSDNDRLLNIYITRYKDRNTKKVLIVSSSDMLKNNLKIKLLSIYKDFFVTSIDKKMEYEIVIRNQKFDFIIIDTGINNAPLELISFGKESKYNKNAKFILYQLPR